VQRLRRKMALIPDKHGNDGPPFVVPHMIIAIA
jgi:hypothetical protein